MSTNRRSRLYTRQRHPVTTSARSDCRTRGPLSILSALLAGVAVLLLAILVAPATAHAASNSESRLGCTVTAYEPVNISIGEVSAIGGLGNIRCDSAHPTVGVEVCVQTQRWWGGWETAGECESSESTDTTTAEAGAAAPCPTGHSGTYRTRTFGYIITQGTYQEISNVASDGRNIDCPR